MGSQGSLSRSLLVIKFFIRTGVWQHFPVNSPISFSSLYVVAKNCFPMPSLRALSNRLFNILFQNVFKIVSSVAILFFQYPFPIAFIASLSRFSHADVPHFL